MKKNPKIKVIAQVTYLPEHSCSDDKRYLWNYDITIENSTDEIIQLLSRYWRVTDMGGHAEEVRGPGVIGLQPIIKPNKQFTYSSFCQLAMPQGTMEGYYVMQTLDEERFIAEIPKFILDSPMVFSDIDRTKFH